MRAAIARAAAALLALSAAGCQYAAYFVRDTPRPMQVLEARMDPYVRRSCLIVMLPGMLDGPDSFLAGGFVEDAAAASSRCDVALADAHFGYYRDGSLRRRVASDVLYLADQRGYDEIWLVGVSMGGLGALLVAQEHPELVGGVVLFAPFLGDDALIGAIERAGGLASWEAPAAADRYDEDEFDDALWGWLTGYATRADEMPPLYVGHGDADPRAGVSLLAAHLPEERHGQVAGGHDWRTWRALWQRLLRSPPWDPRAEPPSLRGG